MIQLHYTRSGDSANPTVIFLHGFMGDHRDWGPIIGQLADAYDCVAVDLPGHGRSIDEGDAYDFDSVATSIIELADTVKADSFSLVGYSMGARIALYFGTLYAMRVDALVLESGSPGLKTEAERAARRERDAALACHLQSQPFKPFIDAWYAQPMFAAMHGYADRFAALRARRLEQDPEELAINLIVMGTGVQPSVWDELPKHHIPTLLITGEHDAKFRSVANEMAALSQSIEIEIVPGCGHNVHFEAPELYAARLRAFLDRHRRI